MSVWVCGSQTWIGWRFQGRLVMWIAGLVCLLIARISPWHALRFGSLSHYLRQFLCTQVVVRRKKLSCIRTSHTSAVAASVSSPHAVYSRSLPGRLSRRVEITVKSQITGPVVGLSDDLFSVEKVTLKTSHHNFHPWVISIDPRHHHMTCISKNVALRTRNLLGEDPRKSQKYILKKKVRPNHQVGKKNRCHYITNPNNEL